MGKSRIENSVRNSTVALLSQGLTVVLSFVTRTIFIKYLGASYLGINGLFTNILTVLSFAELGFGTAIVFALYKPIAENHYRQISALMNFYAKIYRCVGLFILLSGVCLLPNLDFFINGTSKLPEELPPVWLIYILYLSNSSVSYFFNYKRSLVIASQNGYIDTLNQLIFNFIRNVAQILILIIFKGFLLYLIVQIFSTLLSNIFISIKANKLFPYLKDHKHEKLDKSSLKSIVKNVLAMAFHKLGSVIVSGTDNILISKFIGIVATGYYSNYTLLTMTVQTVYIQILSPITASVGNFITTKSEHESYKFFKKLLFINAYIAIFCTTCLTTLVNSFITLLWGKEYVFSIYIVLCIMAYFFLNCMRQASNIFIDASGLFWQIKWKSLIEAIVNLSVSLYFVISLKMGIAGIILGNIVSCLTTNFWWEPYVVFKYKLKVELYKYFLNYTHYTLVLILNIVILFGIETHFQNGILGFLLRFIVSACIPNLIIWICYHRTEEYKYFHNIASKLFGKLMKKNVLKLGQKKVI
ncbi:oligosaccharide flippase family protein [Bacillus sp. BRMEA1]|uniref:lipopolysaccharide biosynthesis protein n=1 Tax=Neobacillus endophyticus TaxID=2738405 RepID=UPI00156345AC|nr:oligosaccharide flippase family protein [Neobacillus endophyticus]NRD76943.1 oligosaccharide flippase family protein [Neobacillus endophyticus]